MSEPVLLDDELDENCYRARLAASLAGVRLRIRAIDVIPGGEQDTSAFRRISPAGHLPALTDIEAGTDGLPAICGTTAVLLTLAALGATRQWQPGLSSARFAILHWMDFAATGLQPFVRLRRLAMFGGRDDETSLRTQAEAAFTVMEDHMVARRNAGASWFAGDSASLADIALFPSFALARDAGLDHEDYPALRIWMRHVRALPGFISMPGIPDYM